MSVQVLYFAGAHDITHIKNEEIAIPPQSAWTLEALLTQLVQKYGDELAKLFEQCMFAVNMEAIDKDNTRHVILKPGDEIGIIPPVSGG
ncbi:molybdopterin converting factor, subunit 1 [Lichtheimia ornata]|uniref:Molybdopterin converting factor, subunit 1 n=1 Tax=Lichtheimia ornata TaxID=688661 RepID=A0AAD7V4L2_9FUNG|nr:molybdopterin converting factor, subunit 1 [Lichtheimia ornata]KAJ8659253.1 molybdopterin converting factor, subunit 1 [Lichtheimia ornata]